MESNQSNILNAFLDAPQLKIHSATYPFENLDLLTEEIYARDFNFPRNAVLGMQAEACLHAYFTYSKQFQLLAANLQIEGENQTLGELDFIIKDIHSHFNIHIEVTCKFYLYNHISHTNFEENWVGPNRKDSLFEKLEKIKHKQFPMLKKAETRNRLQSLHIEMPQIQNLFFKAFLFIPKRLERFDFPAYIQNCIVGYYINLAELVELEGARYAIPTKKEWLLPLEAITLWSSFSEIKILILDKLHMKTSPLIYQKRADKTERFFVVWW